jgi:hypothetical protein
MMYVFFAMTTKEYGARSWYMDVPGIKLVRMGECAREERSAVRAVAHVLVEECCVVGRWVFWTLWSGWLNHGSWERVAAWLTGDREGVNACGSSVAAT